MSHAYKNEQFSVHMEPNPRQFEIGRYPATKSQTAKQERYRLIGILGTILAVVIVIGVASGIGIYFGGKNKTSSTGRLSCSKSSSSSNTGQTDHVSPAEAAIGGNCWKGSKCDACQPYTSVINSVQVCCANCARNSKTISSRSCVCHRS